MRCIATTDVEGISESSIHKEEDTRQAANLSGGARTIESCFLFIRDAPFTENWLAVLGFRLTSICECSSLINSKQNTIFGPV
jgi:hypothetical protein